MPDILDEVSELGLHTWAMRLWPRMWDGYGGGDLRWETAPLSLADREKIPSAPGIYTLIVQPAIAGHPSNSCLMYVGQAVSLRERFGRYLTRERADSGRPKLVRLLKRYEDHILFCFTQVPKDRLTSTEAGLITAFIPPANDKFPARISRVVNAF